MPRVRFLLPGLFVWSILVAFGGAEEPPGALSGPGGEAVEERILEALEQEFSPTLKDAPLSDVVRRLRKATGLEVRLDRNALDDIGLVEDAPVTLEARNISLRSGLNLMLRPLKLNWIVEHGALVITTRHEARLRLYPRAYDVSDLLSGGNEEDRLLTGFIARHPYFCGSIYGVPHLEGELLRLIVLVVEPATWSDVGGPGSIKLFGDSLVVLQTRQVHAKVESLLAALREAQRMAREHPEQAPPQMSIAATDGGAHVSAALERVISVEWTELPLANVMTELEEEIGVSIVIDRRALDDVGMGEAAPVTFSAERTRVGDALASVLSQLELAWRWTDEVLLITTPVESELRPEIRVYPVHDLLDQPSGKSEIRDRLRPVGIARVIDVITASAAPGQWATLGGRGEIRGLSSAGAVAIAQTRENHAAVEQFLAELRRQSLRRQGRAGDAQDEARPADLLPVVIYPLSPAPRDPSQPPPDPLAPADLEDMIQALVEPDTWDGEAVYLKAAANRLVVRQSPRAHRRIAALLMGLGMMPPADPFTTFGSAP